MHLLQRLPKTRLVLITPPPIWEPKLEEMNYSKSKLPTLDRTNERLVAAKTLPNVSVNGYLSMACFRSLMMFWWVSGL
jgi:hypothetical protein